MDVYDAEKRSAVMRAVRSRDTKPEVTVRHILHRAGFRFRLHSKTLPGKPDIVLSGKRAVVFVHGCFWHQYRRCKNATRPSSNTQYWEAKLNKNISRDKAIKDKLKRQGWRVLVLWECEIRRLKVLPKIERFFRQPALKGSTPSEDPKNSRKARQVH
jgi:DNA mismatch endonuclease (patch repair protein)